MTQSLARGPLDLRTLLAPISEESPVGEFLLYEGTYDRIREARRSDDAGESRGIWNRDLKAADWGSVESLCLDALENRTKDIQIAGWMAEAAFRQRGFAGLREGLEVLIRLSEAYWTEIHPPLDGDGEFRAAPFHWMNEKLAPDLFYAVVARPQGEREAALSWHDWKRSVWMETVRARNPKEAEVEAKQGAVDRDEFNRRVAATPRSFYEAELPELTRALELVRDLEGLLDREMRERSPSLVRFRENLSEMHGWMRTVIREAIPPEPLESLSMMKEEPDGADVDKQLPDGPAAAPRAPVRTSVGGAFNGREDAYRQLEEAALYLRAIEPHSPAPYLALRAVAWGEKSLNELIREFMKNGFDLEALTVLLGLEEGGGRQ